MTDGQTDRIVIARPRLHSMQRGKNASTFYFESTFDANIFLNFNFTKLLEK